jgi:hypothetical protein
MYSMRGQSPKTGHIPTHSHHTTLLLRPGGPCCRSGGLGLWAECWVVRRGGFTSPNVLVSLTQHNNTSYYHLPIVRLSYRPSIVSPPNPRACALLFDSDSDRASTLMLLMIFNLNFVILLVVEGSAEFHGKVNCQVHLTGAIPILRRAGSCKPGCAAVVGHCVGGTESFKHTPMVE